MDDLKSPLFDASVKWLHSSFRVKAAVLFGSSAIAGAPGPGLGALPGDFDFHLVVSGSPLFQNVDWNRAFPGEKFLMQANRAATGSVRKVTVIFHSGQIELVLVPVTIMRIVAFCIRFKLHRKVELLRRALNEMATCLHSGYRFIKGCSAWGRLYQSISLLPGVRIGNSEVRLLADSSVCDIVWVLQKLDAGELVAAQHVLHSSVSDTNLRLWRELRVRQGLRLPSFGLGRRVESLATEHHRILLSVDARLNYTELSSGTKKAFLTLKALMIELDPSWRVPAIIERPFHSDCRY